MTHEEFIQYLVDNGCEIVRIANQGYFVMRNVINSKMSGVPATDPPLSATVCRICKTLSVDPPDGYSEAQAIIDDIHREFQDKEFSPENGNL